MRRCLLVLLGSLAIPTTLFAEDALTPRDQTRALEQQIRTTIDATEPCVVAVIVSHLKYPPEHLPANEQRIPGRLGGYSPPKQPMLPAGLAARGEDPRFDLSDPEQVGEHKFGSGLVLNEQDGLILTNFHLIDGATKIYVRTANGSGSYADIHAADARSDLAVLRLLEPPEGMKPVRFATVRLHDGPGDVKATLFRGMFVIALGHPLALGFTDGQPSASWGILSNIRRRAAGPPLESARYRELHRYGTLLQTDARVTLGSSGGGLFDLDGRAIGMTAPLAAITGADTAGGFAVPFDRNYRRIVEVLKQGKEVEYGFLGVSMPLNDGQKLRHDKGLLIGTVTPGSPAALAGLTGTNFGAANADTILDIDGQPVRDADDLFLYIGAALAGTKVRLTVARNGQSRPVDVTLAKFYHPLPAIVSKPGPDFHGLRVDYSSMRMLKNQDVSRLVNGVTVRSVDADSQAATRFRTLGGDPTRWMITHVDNKPVPTPTAFYEAVAGKAGVQLRLENPNETGPTREQRLFLP